MMRDELRGIEVAPFTGAWIEIRYSVAVMRRPPVAPFTGAWIEIVTSSEEERRGVGRTLHGCVD